MPLRFLIAALICCGIVSRLVADDQALAWQQNDEGVRITENGQVVLFYQRTEKSIDGRYSRSHYVHPLYDLGGNVLTEDFPKDHLHHRGIFWAWHQLRIGDKSLGDGWALRNFRWEVRKVTPIENDDGSVTLDLLVHWKSSDWKDGREAVMVETSSIRIYPSQQGRRTVDFEIRLRAKHEHTVLGGSEDAKGYGGFSVRIKLPTNVEFTSQNGVETPGKTAVGSSAWMSMTGSLGGTDSSTVSGLTVLCHPASAGYPQPWILRSERSMQNPVWPGRNPQPISTEHPTVLRYRLVIHEEPASPQQIEQWHRDYQRQP